MPYTPSMIPKDPPQIDRELIARLAASVSHCEWPLDCHASTGLQTAHIRARGMGGGRRKDTEDNLVRLCSRHHREYDSAMGQSPANQEWMRASVIKRPDWMRDNIRGEPRDV